MEWKLLNYLIIELLNYFPPPYDFVGTPPKASVGGGGMEVRFFVGTNGHSSFCNKKTSDREVRMRSKYPIERLGCRRSNH